MFADLRVPVERTAVEVLTSDGQRRALMVFQAPGQALDSFVESHEPFFPAHEGEAFRLFARAHVVSVTAERLSSPPRPEDDLPETRRAVRVHLCTGSALVGELRYVPSEGASRPIDHLNEDTRSFPVFADGRVHHVVKAHVVFVEEVK